MLNPATGLTLSHIAIALGIILTGLGGFGKYYFERKPKSAEIVFPNKQQVNNVKTVNGPVTGEVHNQTINYYQPDLKIQEPAKRDKDSTNSKGPDHKRVKEIAPSITQISNGSGDNVAGDKVINNYSGLHKATEKDVVISSELMKDSTYKVVIKLIDGKWNSFFIGLADKDLSKIRLRDPLLDGKIPIIYAIDGNQASGVFQTTIGEGDGRLTANGREVKVVYIWVRGTPLGSQENYNSLVLYFSELPSFVITGDLAAFEQNQELIFKSFQP
jgi:hypothetical protein